MKTLLTALVIGCGALLPITQATAGPAGEFAKKKLYGDFAAGKKFSLTVTELVSEKVTLTGGTSKAAIPAGIPKFKKGQKVKFTIGTKGELKGAGFNLKFQAGSSTSNAYVNKPSKGNTQADTGLVFKNNKKNPDSVALTFFKVKAAGFNTTTYVVHYTLE